MCGKDGGGFRTGSGQSPCERSLRNRAEPDKGDSWMSTTRIVAGLTAAMLLSPHQADATEAVAGHYVTGAFALPKAAVIPPPGLYWNLTTSYYNGSISGDVEVPVAGEVRLGLDATFGGPNYTALWVPQTEMAGGASFQLGLTLPVLYLSAEASAGRRNVEQSQTDFGDISISPKIGWNSGHHFFTAGLNIFAPTGAWEEGALDNIGMNYWTFSPTVAYTYFDPARGLDFSINAGLDFNTENPDTDYHSGTLFHMDAVLIKQFNERFGAGLVGSMLYQIEDDEGGLADRLDGFRGRSYALGPIITYEAGPKENPISIALSWASEFEVKNRFEGDAVYLSISGTF